MTAAPVAPVRTELLSTARDAMAHAYAPYSGFSVGAALLTESGAIYAGCNVENASYPVSLCAERSAILNAVVHEPGVLRIREILIVVSNGAVAAPCGACRQAIHEFGADATITLVGDHEVEALSMRQLLPRPFGPADLALPTTASTRG